MQLRPPQPACYVFVLDVSSYALETGYLSAFTAQFLNCMDRIPGDARFGSTPSFFSALV